MSFTLKRFVFSTIAQLLNDTLFLAFVSNFRGVDRMLGNEFGVKTSKCCGVSCEGAMIVFLSGSAPSSLTKESTSGCLLVGATLLEAPGKGEAFRVIFFCDTGSGAGVFVSVTTLETSASSLYITRLEENASSGIIEGLKG
jgi:hypothetical protein